MTMKNSSSVSMGQRWSDLYRPALAIWQHLSSVLIILLSLGAGLGNATSQAQTSAYVTNLSGTVSVIDTTTNTVVATIPVGIFPSVVAITPDGRGGYERSFGFSNYIF